MTDPTSPNEVPALFYQSRLKIERANDHINEARIRFNEFAQSNFHRFFCQKNPKPPRYVLGLEVAPVPIGIALATGDAVHNLHSALDYITSFMCADGNIPNRRVHFPKHETRDKLVGSIKQGFKEKAGAKVVDAILDEIRPYRCGENANVRLWSLTELDNADKHRLITPVLSVAIIDGFNAKAQKKVTIENGEFTIEGGGVFEFMGSDVPFEIENYRNSSFDIVFRQGELFEGESVIPTLFQLSELTLEVVQIMERCFFGTMTPYPLLRSNYDHLGFEPFNHGS